MKKIVLLITVLAMAFASCNREDSHITTPNNPDNPQGGVIVGFNTDGVTGTKFEDTHLYGFDAAQKMILHRYYPTQKELSSDLFQMDNGAYTFIAVLNVGQGFSPETRADMPLHNTTLNQFMSYVKRSEASYPDMITGMINRTIINNTVERIEIPLADKSGGITATTTILTTIITLPDAEFETYQLARTRATAEYNLRGAVEFYQKNVLISRTTTLLTPTATASKYTLTAEVFDGEYEMALWVDYTSNGSETDLWYNTQSLQAIKLITDNKAYTTSSDSREVFYYTGTVTAEGGKMNTDIATERPQAKYTLISNDIERYNELRRVNPDKYVPLDELSITVLYEGFLPCGFNTKEGKPNDSETGFKYRNDMPTIGATDTEVTIGSDYVFVNGTESSVVVTVVVTDQTGRTVSRVSGTTVNYQRNKLTTITGDFLTAGVINPGINIDTNWDDVYEVEF